LKPVATWCASGYRAEVVDLCFRNPLLVSDRLRCGLRYGTGRRSRTLMAGQRREIGRYEVPRWRGLPALRIGIIRCVHRPVTSAHGAIVEQIAAELWHVEKVINLQQGMFLLA